MGAVCPPGYNTKYMGKYQQQHNNIANALQDVKTTSDALFTKLHNGHAETNNLLKTNRDAVTKAKTLFDMHDEESVTVDRVQTEVIIWRSLAGAAVTTILTVFRMEILAFLN